MHDVIANQAPNRAFRKIGQNRENRGQPPILYNRGPAGVRSPVD